MACLACSNTPTFLRQSFAAVFGLKIAALNIALPIGISFYTFQLISYVIDVYRADVEPQRDYVAFAAYISMFPQLIAGPIVRYSDIEAELTARAYGADKAAYGARRFILGLGKKVLIANVLAELVNAFKASGEKSTLFCSGICRGIHAACVFRFFRIQRHGDWSWLDIQA